MNTVYKKSFCSFLLFSLLNISPLQAMQVDGDTTENKRTTSVSKKKNKSKLDYTETITTRATSTQEHEKGKKSENIKRSGRKHFEKEEKHQEKPFSQLGGKKSETSEETEFKEESTASSQSENAKEKDRVSSSSQSNEQKSETSEESPESEYSEPNKASSSTSKKSQQKTFHNKSNEKELKFSSNQINKRVSTTSNYKKNSTEYKEAAEKSDEEAQSAALKIALNHFNRANKYKKKADKNSSDWFGFYKANKHYRKARNLLFALEKDNPRIQILLGYIYRDTEKYSEAAHWFRQAEKGNNDSIRRDAQRARTIMQKNGVLKYFFNDSPLISLYKKYGIEENELKIEKDFFSITIIWDQDKFLAHLKDLQEKSIEQERLRYEEWEAMYNGNTDNLIAAYVGGPAFQDIR